MKNTLKIGQKINHYCSGLMVEGEITEIFTDGVTTKHKAVTWGGDIYRTTFIPFTSVEKHNSVACPAITKVKQGKEII